MTDWRPQLYRSEGKTRGVEDTILDAATATGEAVIAVNPSLPPIFTLKHLALLTGTEYGLLRRIVSRRMEDPYRVFRIRKRRANSGRSAYRIICVPDPMLLTVQRWLAQHVLALALTKVHSSSTAYARGSNLIDAVKPHCRCRWMIKLDIKNFFESITELAAYRAYRSLGYQKLVAFELARLSTRLGSATFRHADRWLVRGGVRYKSIGVYAHWHMGHLPQGAPTSPMLANMAMLEADRELSSWARQYGLVYTRYADDMTLSTNERSFDRTQAKDVIRGVYKIVGKFGLSPNTAKTQIVPPGARKIVLGLSVDGADPRLTRDFKANLRMHLYYLRHQQVGPAEHARRRGFTAVAGLRNYLHGLAAYASQIEAKYGKKIISQLSRVVWPI